MAKRRRPRPPIIVEGKPAKIRLDSLLDAEVFTTGGFSLFKRDDKLAFFRRISEKGIIILTDSDGAGTLIRSHLCSAIPKDRIYQLYTPKIEGKEKRKKHSSAEGVLGVEGVDADLLRALFLPFADGNTPKNEDKITKTDLYVAGMSGGDGPSERRAEFARRAGLPDKLSPNALLSALNVTMTRDEFFSLARQTEKDEK